MRNYSARVIEFVGDFLTPYKEKFFFFSSRRRHTRLTCDWSSDVCSSDLTRPHAGKAVGLQFELHRQGIRLCLGGALLGRAHLAGDAEQVLHVVTDLVR